MSITLKRILYLGRWLLGLSLILLLLLSIQWQSIADLFLDVSIVYLAVLLALSFVLIWVSCIKWGIFLSDRGQSVSILNLMSLYLVGYFFNHFLPSQYGGDLVRSYELGREIDSHVTSFGSVFMERYTGLLALVAVSSVAAIFRPDQVMNARVGIPFLAAWGGMMISLWLIADPRTFRFIITCLKAARLERIVAAAESFYSEIRSAWRNPGILFQVMSLSLLFHFLAVVNTYVAVLSIHAQVGFLGLMLVVPIILLVSMIPLTVNSIGLFEGAFVYFLAPLGLTDAQALTIALVLRGKNVIMAILGGGIYLFRMRKRH